MNTRRAVFFFLNINKVSKLLDKLTKMREGKLIELEMERELLQQIPIKLKKLCRNTLKTYFLLNSYQSIAKSSKQMRHKQFLITFIILSSVTSTAFSLFPPCLFSFQFFPGSMCSLSNLGPPP